MSAPNPTEYARILWARRYLLAGILLVVFGGVMVLTLRQTPLYRASARLVVPRSPGILGGADSLTPAELRTQAELIGSSLMARLVVEELGLDVPPRVVLERLTAEPVPETLLVEITYESPDPQEAAVVANAVGDTYLAYRIKTEKGRINDLIRQQDREIRRIDERLAELRGSAGLESTTEREQLLAEKGRIRSTIASLELATGRVGRDGQIVDRAVVPASPFSPNVPLNAGLGLAAGLFFGSLAAVLADFVRDELADAEDVEQASGVPVLATLPLVRRTGGGLFVSSNEHSPFLEAMRTLRTNVQSIVGREGIRTILVTSPMIGDGKTIVATNLAASLAQAGKRVVCVDADLRRPRVHEMFGIGNRLGLATLLKSGISPASNLQGAVQNPGTMNIRVIPAGPVPSNPTELLDTPAMSEIMAFCSSAADVVVIDSPPVGLADASVLAGLVDGILLVVRHGGSRRALRHARGQLDRVNAPIIGAVVNGLTSRSTASYYESYGGAGTGRRPKRRLGARFVGRTRGDRVPPPLTDAEGADRERKNRSWSGRAR